MSYKDMYFTEEPYSRQCDACGKVFRKEDAFHVHASCYPVHLISPFEVQCSGCEFRGAGIQNVKQHFKCKHLLPKFTCLVPQGGGVCGEKFSLKASVLSHLQTSHFCKQKGKKRARKPHSLTVRHELDDKHVRRNEDTRHTESSPGCMAQASPSGRKSDTATSGMGALMDASADDVELEKSPGWDKLLDVSLKMLLQKLFHCPDCDAYFLTRDLHQKHFAAHADSPPDQRIDESGKRQTIDPPVVSNDSTRDVTSTDPVAGDSVASSGLHVFPGSMTGSADLVLE